MKKTITLFLVVFSFYMKAQDFNDQLAMFQGQDDTTFGGTVDIDGDYAIVGANGEGPSSTGAVYIYKRASDGSWLLQQRLEADDKDIGDNFGVSVAISGSYAVVGAHWEDHGNGVYVPFGGSVYIFKRSGTTWSQVNKITNSDRAGSDEFGTSVDIDGNTIVVGSYRYTTGRPDLIESAYVFERIEEEWLETAILKGTADNHWFGSQVAVQGNTIIVGAPKDNSASIYKKSGSSWTLDEKLNGTDGNRFGSGVDVYGNKIIVGGSYGLSRAAYIYEKNTSWTEVVKIQNDEEEYNQDGFGNTVSLKNGKALIGLLRGRSAKAFLYKEDASGVWKKEKKYTLTRDGLNGGLLSSGVRGAALSNSYAIVGFYNKDRAYIFDANGGTTTSCTSFMSIPDANFEQALLDQNIDTDGVRNGRICIEDAERATTLDVSAKNIASLAGIEAFTNLVLLKAESNALTQLNVLQNKKLTELYCFSNQLTSLNVTGLTALEKLHAYRNSISGIDLSTNIALKELNMVSNQLTTLDLTNNSQITSLGLMRNSLENITFGATHNDLFMISVANNRLTTLDLSPFPALTIVNCRANQLTTLNVKNGNNNILRTMVAFSNQLDCITVDDIDYANAQPLPASLANSAPGWRVDDGVVYNDTLCLTNAKSGLGTKGDMVLISPNPIVNGTFKVNSVDKIIRIALYDTSGKRVFTSHTGMKQIDISGLSKGLYIVQVQTKNDTAVEKVYIN